ncbi:MAG: hypothetical protein ABI912_02550 [Actinomycetota bacterium]
MGKARAILIAIAFILVTSPLAATTAVAKVKPGCPGATALVVDATLTVRNVDDRAVDGHVWALDAYSERVRLWHVDADRYCAQLEDNGTFTSFAGVSPALTGTISAGVTGSFVATQYISVTGDFAPKAPTTGFIGDFDTGCNQDGVCANHDDRFTVHYFDRVRAARFGWFSALYGGGTHGTFTQSTDGNMGDITG